MRTLDDLRDRARRARFRHKLLRPPLIWWRSRDITDADIYLASYPRSGTTWLRFLITELITRETATFDNVPSLFPYVGFHRHPGVMTMGGSRFIQTHECHAKRGQQVIYVVRDPRSVVVSEYFWNIRKGLAPGDLSSFVRDFARGRTNPWGSWGGHVSFWSQVTENSERLLVIRYEDLKLQAAEQVREVVDFLNIKVTDDEIERGVEGNSLRAMREKETVTESKMDSPVNPDVSFVGGTKGDWRTVLEPAHISTITRAFGEVMERQGYKL